MNAKAFDLRDKIEMEIHNMKPSWWMRYGILSAFIILLIVLILGHIIEYPDRIFGEFRLLSSQPAIAIPLHHGVQIEEVFAENGSFLRRGHHILRYNNSTNYSDLIKIDELLKAQINNDSAFLALFEKLKHDTFQLGELQGLWTQLYDKLFEHYTIISIQKYDSKIKRLSRQLNKQYQLDKKLKVLLRMNASEKNILNEFASIDSILSVGGVISKVNYLQKEEEYLIKTKGQQQHEISAKRNELEILNLINAIEVTKEEKQENWMAVCFQITETISKLRSEIETWKKRHLVEAPIDGTLNYLGRIADKEFVDIKEHAIVITPREENFKAVIKIPFLRSGKVKKGQTVHFKLKDYPHHEYGYLEGKLNSITDVAGLDSYLGEVNLGKKLRTNYQKNILIKENMSGIAEIITDDRSILARVLDKFLYVFRRA